MDELAGDRSATLEASSSPRQGTRMLITGDQQLLRQMNRMALVRRLAHEPQLSRADLAVGLGLTKSTVGLLVKELVEEGWLNENEIVTTGSLGRRPTPLHIDGQRLALIGADVGVDAARVVVVSLLGEIVDRVELAYDNAADAPGCLKLVAKQIVRLAKRAQTQGRRTLGVGIGLHGGVDDTTGLLHVAPNMGWRNVPAAALVRAQLDGSLLEGLPLFVQNEADVAALAEFEFVSRPEADPLVYLSLGHGVGAGVVVRDKLLTGYRGFAGEVGHTILQAAGPQCSCGRRGCAEALIGLRALVGGAPGDAPAKSKKAVGRLFAAVDAGDATALKAVQAAGKHLGMLLNNLWVSYDPMRIVLGGPAMRLGDALQGPARKVLAAYAAAAQLPAPAIEASHYGTEAVAAGAAALVRYQLTRPITQQGNHGVKA
jgi:predicted NBD/HSP70 family sugar kinase/DNA-binding transcriptional ArsR family regulator